MSIAAWSTQVSTKCAACVFSDGSAATWTPILTDGDELKGVNRGSCIEIKSGKESCGRAYQQITECRLEACLSNCKTQSEFTNCLSDSSGIFTGPCKAAYDKMELDCGANLGAYESGCKGASWTFQGPIKAQCVNGS